MTEQTQRLKKALDGCAERGISPTPEPWTQIEGRLDARAAAPARGPRRLLPRSRAGLALAAALVVLFGMGAFAASGLVYEEFRLQLPGARGPVYGEQLDLQQTANGVRVSVEWAYADSGSAVVGYNIEDLEGDRRVAGQPAELGSAALKLAGAGGEDFGLTGGQSTTSGNLQPLEQTPASAVFTPERAIEPGERRFRLTIPVEAQELPSMDRSKPVGEPFVFDFEIPVRPSPTVEVGQEVEANGVTLTLERVVNSPARAQAVFCLDPPVDDYYWFPVDEDPAADGLMYEGGPVTGENYCAKVLLADELEGSSSLTVTELEGMPRDPDNPDFKTLPGPWTFEFTVPER